MERRRHLVSTRPTGRTQAESGGTRVRWFRDWRGQSGSYGTITIGSPAAEFFNEQYSTNIHYQMAAATLAVIPLLVLFFLLQRKFVEGMTLSGMKG